jgi:hypothetical protein
MNGVASMNRTTMTPGRIIAGLACVACFVTPVAGASGAVPALPSTLSIPAAAPLGPLAADTSPLGDRTVCDESSWVRASDLSTVLGILYSGNTMDVDRYVVSKGNWWAVGTAHTNEGDVYGYVLDSGTFC